MANVGASVTSFKAGPERCVEGSPNGRSWSQHDPLRSNDHSRDIIGDIRGAFAIAYNGSKFKEEQELTMRKQEQSLQAISSALAGSGSRSLSRGLTGEARGFSLPGKSPSLPQSRSISRIGQLVQGCQVRNPLDDYCYSLVRSDLADDEMEAMEPRGQYSECEPLTMTRHTETGLPPSLRTELGHAEDEPTQWDWLESSWFASISGVAIVTNAIVIGVETDAEYPWEWRVEQGLLAFFILELALKLCRDGVDFFVGEDFKWNMFDLFIVMIGTFDQWMVPVLEREGIMQNEKKRSKSVIFLFLRMARLLRILRLLRLVRLVRPLYHLSLSLIAAVKGMFWVLILLAISIYCTSVFCKEFVGDRTHSIVENQFLDDVEIIDILADYTTVPAAMNELFGVMSGWSLVPLEPLFVQVPVFRIIFVVFYVYSAWAMLAVMSGVVSDNMIALRTHMLKEDEAKEQQRKMFLAARLEHLFVQADEDKSGAISRDEFNNLLNLPGVSTQLIRFGHVTLEDLQELFDWIDHDGSGQIEIKEFMSGFKWVTEPLGVSTLLKVKQSFLEQTKHLRETFTQVVENRYQELYNIISLPLSQVQGITEVLQHIDVKFHDLLFNFNKLVAEEDPGLKDAVHEAEARLTKKLAKVFERIEDLERIQRIEDAAKEEEIQEDEAPARSAGMKSFFWGGTEKTSAEASAGTRQAVRCDRFLHAAALSEDNDPSLKW